MSENQRMPLSKKPRVFYGYWIVVAAFSCVFISSGSGYSSFSLFVKPLQADLGWGRGEIMTAFTILMLVQGGLGLFIGRVVDRYGVKRVIGIGALVTGLGFVLVSLSNSLWHFYLSYIVTGAGMAAIGPVPASAAVSNWFKRKRGLAIGIMSAGLGIGGLVLAPLTGGYFIPNFGWRAACLALALLSWVILIPLALWVIKTKPADMGLYPDGIEAPESINMTAASPSSTEGSTLRMALSTSTLWIIAAVFLQSCFSHAGVMQSQVPYLQDIGFPVTIAATSMGVAGLGSAIGKPVFGWLCDRIPPKYACAIGLVLQMVSIIIFIRIGPTSPTAMILLYAIVMGIGAGSWLPTASMLTSTNFGLANYGAIYGVVNLFIYIGVATGPLMAGHMYDATGTYHWAFIIFLALYAISIPAILVSRRPRPL